VLAVAILVLAVVLIGAFRPHGRQEVPSPAGLPAGWRWESYRDVMVAVPDSWGYFPAPDDQWCVGSRHTTPPRPGAMPAQGYVDSSNDISTDVKCRSEVPPASWFVTHLSFSSVPGDPTPVPHGWSNDSRTFGQVTVNVVADAAHRSLADRILATARTGAVDQNGCRASSRAQSPDLARPAVFDLSSLAGVDSISICQYDVGTPDRSGLVASRELIGASARAELHALRSAPPVPGPRRDCPVDDSGSQIVVLRLVSGETTHDLYVRYFSCFGTGIDDGTRMRSLTSADCGQLWGPRLRLNAAKGRVFAICDPQLRH
jgi:hypothetical protein